MALPENATRLILGLAPGWARGRVAETQLTAIVEARILARMTTFT
jgi:hypothetical protein